MTEKTVPNAVENLKDAQSKLAAAMADLDQANRGGSENSDYDNATLHALNLAANVVKTYTDDFLSELVSMKVAVLLELDERKQITGPGRSEVEKE